MAKKSPANSGRSAASAGAFRKAIETGDVAAVRQLIADGVKPAKDAAEEPAKRCNAAFAVANMREKPMFGKLPTDKQRAEAEAAAQTNYEITAALLAAGARTPEKLCSAARSGNTKLALLLLKHGADVNYNPPMGTPLENAVESGAVELIRALIKAGADVNHQSYLGSVLTGAVNAGQLPAAEELIKAGAQVSAKPKFGQSALMAAVSSGRDEFVRLLLAAGADVNVKDGATVGEYGEPEVKVEGMVRITHMADPKYLRNATPLIVAVYKGYSEIARQLIAAKADLEAVDGDSLSAMAYAVQLKNQEMIKLLSDAGAQSLAYAEGSREAAWIAAAKTGNCERLSAMLKDGVDVNLKHATSDEPEEGTALTHATENGWVDAVKLLLQAGARVDEHCGVHDDARRTALMHAARGGACEVIALLLAAGANVAAKDRSGMSSLHYAARSGQAEALRALVAAGARVEVVDKGGSTPLMEAAGEGHADAVRALLDLKADPNAVTKDGVTALFNAASEGHTAVVKLLLSSGARVESGATIFSPLEAASGSGHDAIVKLLLEAASKEKKGTSAKPDADAIISAVISGEPKIVRTLLEAGADPNSAMAEGQFSALMTAVRIGNLEIVAMLLKSGADVNALNDDRKTALDVAYEDIKIAKDQLNFLGKIGEDDKELRALRKQVQSGGGENEMTAALRNAGGKLGKDLKGKQRPTVRNAEPKPEPRDFEDLPMPDFSKRAKSAEFQKTIQEFAKLCAGKPKEVANDDDHPLRGCVSFRVSSELADQLLTEHHEPLLKRGIYLLKMARGYASGKDDLALLPTDKRNEVFAAFQTSGPNSNVYPADVVRWFDELEKSQPFLLTGASNDWCEGRFTQPIKDSKQLAKQMYEFCSDIVDQGVGDVARLALELKKTQKFYFWWD